MYVSIGKITYEYNLSIAYNSELSNLSRVPTLHHTHMSWGELDEKLRDMTPQDIMNVYMRAKADLESFIDHKKRSDLSCAEIYKLNCGIAEDEFIIKRTAAQLEKIANSTI